MINKNRQYRTYDDELPVFNEKDGGSATSWDDELPEFKDGKEVKKKGSGGLFSKVGSSVGVSGLQSTEVKNEKQVQLPEFKIEDYNRDFENITGHREFSLREPQKPTSLLGQERYEKKKKEFEAEKFLKYSDIEQSKINPVLNNISLGQTNAEELKQLHDSPYGKKIVNEVIDKEIPEFVTDGEKDWEKLAFNINVKNRKNGVELKIQLLYNIDNELASSLNDASTQTTYVNAGTGGGMASTTVNKLPQIDTNNASELSEILQKIQSSDFLLDKNGNKVDKKGIEDKIKTKLFYLSTQEPINPEIYQLSDKINKAVTRANLERDRGENIPIEEYAKNDVINTTHFATGLNYIKYTDPARYKNILSAIEKRETIAGLDFESLSKIGQDIDNEKVYSASASDPSLIGAETNIKYDSYDTKKAEYSKILSEEIKKLGFKNSLKVPSVVIDLAASRHPELTNKEIIKDIKFDESSGGYGIVKGGFINSFFRGVAQPIKSINETINALTQSPVDVYLNSRRLDYGDQKLIDSKGNVTESLPSERRNYFNKAIEGLGQFTTQVTLSYLIGGALGGTYKGITGKTLTQSQKVNLAAYGGGGISTLAQTYGQEYADFLNKTANPGKASLMAFISSLGQSFLEVGILPDVKIAESIKGLLKNPSRELAKGIVDVITKGGGEEAAKPFIQRYVNNIANLYGKEILTEEVLQNVTNYLTEAIFSPKTADNRDLSKETIDVISDATVSFAIPTILGALGNSKTDKQITKDAIHSGGINFNLYKDAFEKAVEKGVLSEQEKDEALNVLSIHKESLDNVPKRDSKGELISTERQLEYAYQNTVAKINESKLSQTDDEVQKEHLEKKIKEANDIKRKIFGGEENKDLPPQKDEYTTEEISKQEVQAAKILATANLPDIYQQQAEQDPIGTLREIAEQAQGFTTDSNGNPIKQDGGGRRDDLIRMGIPESVINKAVEMFPTPFKEEVSTGEQPSTEIKEDEISVGEMIDKTGTYKGERGSFYQDGQTVVFKVEGKNKEYELGNIDEVKNSPISDFDISHEESVVDISDNGNIKVRDSEYKNGYSNPLAAINKDADGNVVSVNLETLDGKKRTFRGNIAEDIAYQINLKEINKNNETRTEFEQHLNEDAETSKEMDNAGVLETTKKESVKNNEPVSREKIKPKQKSIAKEQKPSTVSEPLEGKGEVATVNGFKEAGEKSRDTKDATHIGRWMLDNSRKGDVVRFQDFGYEVTEVNTRKDGTKELVLTPFEFNEDGSKDYNNSGIKIISEQSIKNGSNLFEYAYTNNEGERVTEQSTYEPVATVKTKEEGAVTVKEGEQPTTQEPINEKQPIVEEQNSSSGKIPEMGKFEKKARGVAEKILKAELPSWAKIDLDDGTKTSGASFDDVKKAIANATIQMGKLLDKGVEFGDAVKQAVKDIVDLLGEDRRAEIEKGFSEDYKKNFSESEKNKNEPPPKEPTDQNSETGNKQTREKGILNKLYNAEKTPKSAKEGFEKEGLEYETQSQEEAQGVAKAVIDSFGIDEAVRLAKEQTFDGDVNSLIFGEALGRLSELEEQAKTEEEALEQANKFAEIGIEYDKMARYAGRFNAAINYFYKKSPLGIVIMENAKRKNAFNEWSKPKDKSWRESFDELIKNPEFKVIVDEKVQEQLKKERQSSRAARLKKVRSIFASAKEKVRKSGMAYTVVIPPHIAEAALEAMELAYESGEAVAKIIGDTIDYISKKLGRDDWDKDKFRKEWETTLVEKPSGKKVLTDEEIKAKVLDKFRKKLKGLSEKQQIQVIQRFHKQIIENGGLDYDDFKKIIASVLGRGELTSEQVAKMKELVKKTNDVEEVAKELREKRTPELFKKFREAEHIAGKAAKELNTLFYDKPDIVQRLVSIAQLSTLGTTALIANVVYNIWNQAALRFPIGLVNSLIDAGASAYAKDFGKTSEQEYNILDGQVEFWNKLGFGSKESIQQVFNGLNRMDYTQKEVYGQRIRPARSWVDLISYFKGKKPLTTAQFWDKIIQGTVGVPAEIVARLLNVGDKPLRFAAEGGQAAVFAKTLGLVDMDYKLFVEFPREEAYRAYKAQGLSDEEAGKKADYVKEAIIKEGQRATFQQDNLLNDIITRGASVLGGKNTGTANLAKTLVVSPYIKIPSNAFWSFYNIANPEIAFLQAIVHGQRAKSLNKKGETVKAKLAQRESRYWLAHGIVGIGTRAVILYLASQGKFNPEPDDDDSKKEREATSFFNRGGTTNINGFQVSNRWMGPWGMLGNLIAKKEKNMTQEQRDNQSLFWNIMFGGMEVSALSELESGVFSNSSSLLQSLNSGDWSRYGMNTLNLMANIIQPAAISQLNNAALDYVPTSKGDNFLDKLNQNFARRSTLYRNVFNVNMNYKRDIWGERIPKGGNIVSRAFGISKANPQLFGRILYDDYLRTNDSGFLPPTVLPTLNDKKLNQKQHDKLQEYIGNERKRLVEPYINDMSKIPGFSKTYSELKTDDNKKFVLGYLYSKGRELGLEKFYKDCPEFEPTKEQKNFEDEIQRDLFKLIIQIENLK